MMPRRVALDSRHRPTVGCPRCGERAITHDDGLEVIVVGPTTDADEPLGRQHGFGVQEVAQ